METLITSAPEHTKKNTKWIVIGVLIGVCIWLFLWMKGFYGNMVRLDEELKSYDSQIANMYERRSDLIPMIAQVVDAAAKYEGGTLTNITAYRSMAGGLQELKSLEWQWKISTPEFNQAMNTTLLNMRMMQEAYPSLQAVQGFQNMTTTIEGSENRLRVAIKDSNDKVATYNIELRSFPFWIIGKSLFWFTSRERTFSEVEKGKTVNEKTPNLFGSGN
jgi:LemA protein